MSKQARETWQADTLARLTKLNKQNAAAKVRMDEVMKQLYDIKERLGEIRDWMEQVDRENHAPVRDPWRVIDKGDWK